MNNYAEESMVFSKCQFTGKLCPECCWLHRLMYWARFRIGMIRKGLWFRDKDQRLGFPDMQIHISLIEAAGNTEIKIAWDVAGEEGPDLDAAEAKYIATMLGVVAERFADGWCGQGKR